MSICMAGIDWKNANIDKREAFSFTNSQVSRLCSKIIEQNGVNGCVLLSTCNRTELYLSGDSTLHPEKILCDAAGISGAEAFFTIRTGETAVRHIMRVACGLCSQILGEDQIISQVKRAYQLAHEANSTDAVLSQLFRLAATAGKRSRTQVHLFAVPLSAAERAVALMELAAGSLQGKRAIVIGNGEMGRLAAGLLVSHGCGVTVTLRSYHHGQTIVPAKCSTIPYDKRLSLIETCDILLSATTSPHYTVSRADMERLNHVPEIVCDLSVPRDIESSIRDLDGIQTFLDMDSMSGHDIPVNTNDIKLVEQIIEEQLQEFNRWQTYRNALHKRKIYVVGIGPGGTEQITPRALAAIQQSDIIAGYTTYIGLIQPLIGQKEILRTSMKQEIDRCVRARDAALNGKIVAMVCSGDAGVYGMAGLMHEVCAGYPEIEIEVIPGITAACAGAAVLGAPLIHDFAVISLSDLLTPWEKIEKRLNFASQADFCICLYNPASKKRADYLQKACDIMLKSKSPDTPCGIVRNIGREGEQSKIYTLKQLGDVKADMFTTVFIGNSQTRIINGKLVTPRGYENNGNFFDWRGHGNGSYADRTST